MFGHLTFAILTIERNPSYIEHTLASLFAAGPEAHALSTVHLLVGSKNTDHLRHCRHHRALSLHPLSDMEHDEIWQWTLHRRFCHNYHRCLSLPIPAGGGICIAEDDVIFRDGFLGLLLATIHEMEQDDGLKDYCLSLGPSHDFEAERSFYRGHRYCSYGCGFAGTQCMYYPRHVAHELRDHIWRFGVEQYVKPGDLLIGDLYGDRMYACPRGLTSHIGAVSTGLGGYGSCPSFYRPYELLHADSLAEANDRP